MRIFTQIQDVYIRKQQRDLVVIIDFGKVAATHTEDGHKQDT